MDAQPCDEPSDRDDNNPVDVSADTWSEIFSKIDDFEFFLEHNHSMDY
jgi:uncharacterized protein (DUF1499 family)